MPAANTGTVLITGANGGLGSAIAKQIASNTELSSFHGIYTVRDASAAPALKSALARGNSSHPHNILSLDLTNLANVREVAKGINVRLGGPWWHHCYINLLNNCQARVSSGDLPPIRVLVLAAGFQDFGKQSWTEDGLDTTFAANYLGHWLLVLLLLKSIDRSVGRIIIIGSQGHE
jgi:NAD(P)-dependent dehydrogenase (short-subunit alcohol dehydrogenase family)